MKIEEASREWDLYFNNLNSNQAPAIDDYEKSIFITDAQDQFINGMLMPSHLIIGMQSVSITQLASLIKYKEIDPVGDRNQPKTLFLPYSGKSIVYDLGDDIFAITNVNVTTDQNNYVVTFLNFDEMDRVQRKPYPFPPKKLCYGCIREDKGLEILAHDKEIIKNVLVRYVERPYPVILNDGNNPDFADDGSDTVRGEQYCYSKKKELSEESISPLPDSLLSQIIKLACSNASQVYQQGANNLVNNQQQEREQ